MILQVLQNVQQQDCGYAARAKRKPPGVALNQSQGRHPGL
jgi:hypothetical protein